MNDVAQKLERQRKLLIATGIPLAVLDFGLAALVEGWPSVGLIIMGTYVSVRVLDLFSEGSPA
jgi:hypothetical protein